MKISFQTTDTNQTIDKWKTTEKESRVQRIGTGKGYALEISGTARDNEIYRGHGKTTEEVMQEAGMQDVALTRDYMAVMSNSMSDEEFAKLQEDGYQPGDMEIEQAVTIVDQIKASMLQAGVSVCGYTDTLDMETLTEITGNESLAQDMARVFAEKGVPLTEETARTAVQALEEASALTQPGDDVLKYMVINEKEPVIEDFYKARFSSRTDGSRQGKGYYQDETGYLSRRADSTDLNGLQPQIDKILEEAGLAGVSGAESAAKWLIGEGIPLTKETLHSYMNLTKVHFPVKQTELLQAMAEAVSDRKSPKQASLTGAGSMWEQAADIRKRIWDIGNEAADFVAQQGKSLTLQHLEEAQKLLEGGYKSIYGENIAARRQLEEVRLQMTISANRELLKSGYAIETTELEQLVEALKNVEKQQNQILFCGNDAQETQIRAQLYTETLDIVSRVPSMPVAVIGRVGIFDGTNAGTADFTLNRVNAEGEALAAAYKKAEQHYETFRTRPDSQLGDSINKAFRNVDALLEEVHMEMTEANRRAVRILGYNHLKITKENILTVKAADQLLGNVIDKLTPSATLKMIRDGKNPLTMTVEQLDNYLSDQQQEPEAEQEKFSKFLYKLEQKNEITEEEKTSYIGIYRLLRQIEKTDGAVIGSLIHQGAELSFQNLLTAVRTYRSKPINTVVDDELGTVQEVNQNGSKIDEQIARAFVREIYHNLNGDKFPEKAPAMEESLEIFAKQLREGQTDETAEVSYRRQQVEAFREMQTVSVKQIELLQMLEEPVTWNHLKAAEEFRQNLTKAFMKIKKEADKYNNSYENVFQAAASELEEQFNSRDEAVAAYKALAETEKQILDNAIYENDDITSLDVKELGLIYKQISFTAKLSDTERYEIPLVTENSVTALHLQVIHSEENKGMVEVFMETEDYGRISVSLQMQEGNVNGLFVDFRKENKAVLSELKNQLNIALQEAGFGKEKAEVTQEENLQKEGVSTGELYRAAKTIIGVMHRQAERG